MTLLKRGIWHGPINKVITEFDCISSVLDKSEDHIVPLHGLGKKIRDQVALFSLNPIHFPLPRFSIINSRSTVLSVTFWVTCSNRYVCERCPKKREMIPMGYCHRRCREIYNVNILFMCKGNGMIIWSNRLQWLTSKARDLAMNSAWLKSRIHPVSAWPKVLLRVNIITTAHLESW